MQEENTAVQLYSPRIFLTDILRGALIGIAFIIPGFSGGSVAAILGIYEKIVGAVADVFSHFKRSFLTLLPVAMGIALGAIALLFPLKWALSAFPIPTVCLFVGLSIGGLPALTERMKERPKRGDFLFFALSLLFAVGLCFLPTAGDVDLFTLDFGGYLMLVLVGFVGSCALVVPGISGSMLLLILGYYNPLVKLITEQLFTGQNFALCLAVLGCVLLGMLVGFFLISALMKRLLQRFPRTVYFVIIAFIVGSIPAVFVSVAKEAGLTISAVTANIWYVIASFAVLLLGVALAYLFLLLVRKKTGTAK